MAQELSVQDVASRLGISPVTVENWIRAGFLQGNSSDDLGNWRISEADFEHWVEHEKTKAVPEGIE